MAILRLQAGDSSCTLEIGTEKIIQGAQVSLHAGVDDYLEASAIYEADKGFIILEAMPRVNSQWGDSGYTTSLTARESNFEKTEKIFQTFEQLFSKAAEDDQGKNALAVNWVRKQILDYYFKQTSTNARFEVRVHCKSYTIRGPSVWPFGPGAVLDTKTANIDMDFTFRLLKLITPEELSLVQQFLEAAIAQKQQISFNYQ
ncbi:MAG TPA: hypothetical protein PLS67_08450 [Accumulibacter sp.]|nr:hypothetical protein [Accumulibacter sp.]